MTPNARRWRRALARLALPIAILFVVDATFPLYFWRIPKLTGRAADYGYQYLVDLHRATQPKPADVERVVVFGSSVAGSFERHQVETLLNAGGRTPRVEIERLLKPGMKPSDYALVFGTELERMRPDAVVAMLNFQDFLNPSFERELKEDVQYVLPPWATLRERYPYTSTADKIDLLLASTSNLYRYRRPIRSALQDHASAGAKWLRSRTPKAPYGCYPDGHTAQRFAIPVAPGTTVRLEYWIDPTWIHQRGQVTLRFRAGGTMLTEQVHDTSGWKSVELNVPPGAGSLLQVSADSAWSPRAADGGDDFRLLGVRLRDGCPPDGTAGAHPFRYPPVEQDELSDYLRMGRTSGAAFRDRWQRELEAPTDFGIRFRSWQDSKLRVRDDPFVPTAEFQALERLVATLSERGIAVALVNTPESPLTGDYQDGSYYRGYLAFFDDLARRYPNVRFYNLVNTLPPEDFNDAIHINYVGEIALGPTFAGIIRTALASRP